MPILAERIAPLIARARKSFAADGWRNRRSGAIAMHVGGIVFARPWKVDHAELARFIEATDPDQTMPAEQLAQAIVDRFDMKEAL